jgi:hypothetical protein
MGYPINSRLDKRLDEPALSFLNQCAGDNSARLQRAEWLDFTRIVAVPLFEQKEEELSEQDKYRIQKLNDKLEDTATPPPKKKATSLLDEDWEVPG